MEASHVGQGSLTVQFQIDASQLCLELGMVEEAVLAAQSAVEVDKYNCDAYLGYVSLLTSLNRTSDALTCLDEASKIFSSGSQVTTMGAANNSDHKRRSMSFIHQAYSNVYQHLQVP